MDEIQLKGHYWGSNNKVPKCKIENGKERLKTSRMEQTLRTNKYEIDTFYNWRVTPDVDDTNFTPLVDKIIESCQSWFINGCGDVGKTYLIKLIQKDLTDNNIEYSSLAPTNIAALLINGETLHKFVSKMKRKSCIQAMKIKYIFIDEFSMVHELFYQYLLTVKKIRPDIKLLSVLIFIN